MDRPIKVLLVEDSEDDAILECRELRRAGWEVEEFRVEDAAGLAAALADGTWDVVLTDDALPRFSSGEALRMVAASGLDLPVIVVSGTMSEAKAVEAMKAGARDFVYKGNVERLSPAVEREVREAGNRRALRKAEKSLERAAGIQDLVLRKLPLVLYSRSSAGVRWMSGNAGAVLGFPARAMMEDPGLWDSRIHPEDREVEAVVDVQEGGGDPGRAPAEVRSREFRWRCPEGKWRWFLDHSVAVPPPSNGAAPAAGRGAESLGFLLDITDRKHLHDEFLQAQKMEALGRLAAGVAHDFNNMLMVIQGFGELLASHLPPDGKPASYVREILAAATRSTTLSRQLLAFSRRQVLQPRVLPLNDLITGARSLLEKLVSTGVRIEFDLDPALAPVRVDPGSIDQVLMNLAVNARDAMDGEGVLTIRTANVKGRSPLLPKGAREGDWVMMEVSDTGCGISPELQGRIFDPFFTTKGEGKGTGLGLATVKGIVERSSGLLTVESVPGAGATFRIFLPATAAAPWTMRSPPDEEERGGTETILVVDDERGIREVAKGFLEDLGYRVLTAETGEEALRLLRGDPGGIQLVITDVMMPDMDGAALVRRVEELDPAPGILYVSGYPTPAGSGARAVDPDAEFLAKPFRRDDLARKVKAALRARGRRMG